MPDVQGVAVFAGDKRSSRFCTTPCRGCHESACPFVWYFRLTLFSGRALFYTLLLPCPLSSGHLVVLSLPVFSLFFLSPSLCPLAPIPPLSSRCHVTSTYSSLAHVDVPFSPFLSTPFSPTILGTPFSPILGTPFSPFLGTQFSPILGTPCSPLPWYSVLTPSKVLRALPFLGTSCSPRP